MMYGSTQFAHSLLTARFERSETPLTSNSRRWITTLVAIGLFAFVAACGTAAGSSDSNTVSPITQTEAIEIAEQAMQGFNERDYAQWAGDWSEAMQAAIDEDAFLGFRDTYHGQLGDFVAVTSVTGAPGNDPGVYRWTFDLEFENGQYGMYLAFTEDSKKVEGIQFLEPSN